MDQRNQFSCSRKIEFCDVTSPKVFLENEEDQFDVVIASLVFDVVALNILDFATFLENVVNTIKPGNKMMKKSTFVFKCFHYHIELLLLQFYMKLFFLEVIVDFFTFSTWRWSSADSRQFGWTPLHRGQCGLRDVERDSAECGRDFWQMWITHSRLENLRKTIDALFCVAPEKSRLLIERANSWSDWRFKSMLSQLMNSNGSYECCKPLWRFLKHVKEWIDQQAKIDDDRWCW